MEHIIAKLLNDFERGRMNRRQLIQSIAMAASAAGAAQAASPAGGFQAVTVNHISYQVADYAKTRDFYADLLGMTVKDDRGNQCNLAFGDTFLLPRNARRPRNAPSDAPLPTVPRVDHIAYTIENWDKDRVKAELEKRGLNPRPDTDNSFHVKDPDGFDLQISGKEMKA
ncbi:MAG TPA: VOC family protein [Bryobacteraceae bacterium]|nr:VOC family protein [Bryobacteraceae bacterium]